MPLHEDAFNLTELSQAQTLAGSCVELRRLGAKCYEVPMVTREAVKLGLLDKDTLTRSRNGLDDGKRCNYCINVDWGPVATAFKIL
jgi:hypothetical protein